MAVGHGDVIELDEGHQRASVPHLRIGFGGAGPLSAFSALFAVRYSRFVIVVRGL
jgi:hypothetical protein